jgi:murein DD-endopeptidase MepM/ murein hydrolase activator NlpD
MKGKKKKRGLIRRLRDKYRLIVYNDNTFEEVFQFRLSRLNLISLTVFAVLALIIAVTVLIAFTPLREFIPGYPDGMMRHNINQNALRADSLEYEIKLAKQFINNIHDIASGKTPKTIETIEQEPVNTENIQFTRSKSDSLLRVKIEEEERFNLSMIEESNTERTLSNIHFFKPVSGFVSNSFDEIKGHYGTDIVAGPNEVVKATLDGIVTMSTWTLETGYVIQIQHDNNLISVYKHNANLLKSVGDQVEAGEAIAIVGNLGELTTGPHLHFELWYNKRPLNAEEYIIF